MDSTPKSKGFLSELFNLDRSFKVLLVMAMDAILIVIAAYVSLVLRVSDLTPVEYGPAMVNLVILWVVVGSLLSYVMNVPKISVRLFDASGIAKIATFCAVLAGVSFVWNLFPDLHGPRSLPFIFGLVLLLLMVGVRMCVYELANRLEGIKNPRKRVLIYGAGDAGIQLANALSNSNTARAVAFVDDNPSLRNLQIGRLRVHTRAELPDLLRQHEVSQIVLAIPSASEARKQEILSSLKEHQRELLLLPHFADFLTGASLTEQLRPVDTGDLLTRAQRQIDMPEISQTYSGCNVLVTGAGGSIGSELCKQVLATGPARLILLEQSEYALYLIERRLHELNTEGHEVISILGSMTDARLIKSILHEHAVDRVIHAAAYKHVPILEGNAATGTWNNVFGTRVLAEACVEAGVKSFILVSSDKAVRPTNVMGASKRMAELVIQDLQTRAPDTIFSMVRFGNVMDSSGSVIPLFREQISKGGPVTVTHAEVTRFFMTISEAAQLVLLAGSFAEGGDVFVLDMGEPVKVIDLARNLIRLSGLSERTADNPNGQIEIQITGLRPGEKLYEELLVGSNVIGTPHAKILRARETHLSEFETAVTLKKLRQAIEAGKDADIRAALAEVVDGFPRTVERAEAAQSDA